jgi:hypothetical protein
MKTSTIASLALTLGMLVACGGNVSLGSNEGQLQKGAACNSCSGPASADAKVCPDGSTLGRSCLSNGDGTCGYGFADCPTSNPPADDDGGSPSDCSAPNACGNVVVPAIAKQCADGTSVGYTCIRQNNGACGYGFACPGDVCPNSECSGPRLGAPTIMCSDGSIGGAYCGRPANGKTCSWIFRNCP